MNNDHEQPVDLSSLSPSRDPERFEALVRNIMHEARPKLEARRTANNIVGELARWRRPVLTAAAAASAFLIFSFNATTSRDSALETTDGIAEAIGIPSELAAWMRGDTQLSVADIYEGRVGQ